MKIYLLKKSYFTFRGIESYDLDLLGKTVYELMKEQLCAEDYNETVCSREYEYVVLHPVYPFLTRDELYTYLEEREGSYKFPGGFVVRCRRELTGQRLSQIALGRGLFSLSDYPALKRAAIAESAKYHLSKGVFIEEGAEISFHAVLEEGAIVRSGARVLGKTHIGRDTEIGSGSEITDSVIGANTTVRDSVIMKSTIGSNCTVGPNAYIRPNCVVADNCRIGDFVELKNAKIGRGSKVAHLAYVGDADLGERVNVGCGVVFVNYNGRKKSRIYVGNNCFIGSNCNLIAPLTMHEGAYLAAGTTLTQDLNCDDFCIGRCRESIKPHRAKEYYSPGE